MSMVTVDANTLNHFPLTPAEKLEEASQVTATGAIFPDVSKEIPVISLANGRVVDIKVRLDDYVKKGDLVMKVQSPDVSTAFNAYLKAVNDEQLTNKAFIRAKELLDHGAISQAMYEQAEDSEKDAKADLTATEEQIIPATPSTSTRPLPGSSSRRMSPRPPPPESVSPGQLQPSPSPTSPTSGSSAMSLKTTLRKSNLASWRRFMSSPIPTKSSPAASATSAPCSTPPFEPPRSVSKSPIPAG
jgi:multidrug efflux pump subunit AcrA (membrane-fusion protein)